MFIAVRNGIIVERSDNEESLLSLDSDLHEVFEWTAPLPPHEPGGDDEQVDPRTDAQKAESRRNSYRGKRRAEYPPVHAQLAMMYDDLTNGTTTWADEILRVREKYPRERERAK